MALLILLWTKMAISFFSLLILMQAWQVRACELSEEVISLSGPVTMLFEELHLLEDPKLLGISKFHPVKKTSRKVRTQVLPGGLFLSKKKLKEFQGKKVFFDKSREFKTLLERSAIEDSVELDTRGKTPFEVFDISINSISKSLKNCSQRIYHLRGRVKKIKETLTLHLKIENAVFYLGAFGRKIPELVIGNDGFVLSLKGLRGFSTYPSELAYIVWSKKEMNRLKGFYHYGVSDGSSGTLERKKIGNRRYNISMRGALIPGIRQIYFLEQLKRLK